MALQAVHFGIFNAEDRQGATLYFSHGPSCPSHAYISLG
jgi:hypothetical protein